MLTLHQVSYRHPNGELLLDQINFNIRNQQKIALTGNNGAGKSTLLRIMAGRLQATSGSVRADTIPYYVPQHFGQLDQHSVAKALQIEHKLKALQAILGGDVSETNMTLLDDDWGIEERCKEALLQWELEELELSRQMGTLSGGQKTRVLLAGIMIHRPPLVLLDEPGNHLDLHSRTMLYNYIASATETIVVVSHDRSLLNIPDTVWELSKKGIAVYGGNYDFYEEQKAIGVQAYQEELDEKAKALRKAKAVERAAAERQQKLDARGKKKQEKAGLPTIAMNTLRNNAEKSTAKTKEVHAAKTGAIAQELAQLRKDLPDRDTMKLDFDDTTLHRGKILAEAKGINYNYNGQELWQEPLSFQLTSGTRMSVKGNNGSGKTTLIKLISGQLQPSSGSLYRADARTVYLDQDYSLINNNQSVYDQVFQFNTALLPDHELKSRLNRFLFTKEHWDKSCAMLSGGERMRLALCCLSLSGQAPDIIILDEPTNNLDIQNMEILTAAVNDYKGTIIVVSHDTRFLEDIGVDEVLEL